MISDDQIDESLAWLADNAKAIGKAKGVSYMLSEARKSKKSEYKVQCNQRTESAKEDFAYNHPEYKAHLKKTGEAIAEYEELRVMMKYHESVIEAWRSQSANNRIMGKFQ